MFLAQDVPSEGVKVLARKALRSMLLLLLFALSASAQAVSNLSAGPEVTVIQKKWRIEVRNPALENNPRAQAERQKQEHERRATERINEELAQKGMPPQTTHVPEAVRDTEARGLSVAYIYEVKFSNTGPKGIRTITWEYVFLDPGTKREVGRRRFVSDVSIGRGKTQNVVMRSALSPTGTIAVTKAGKKSRDQYSEQVMIKSVEYADGSVWQAISK